MNGRTGKIHKLVSLIGPAILATTATIACHAAPAAGPAAPSSVAFTRVKALDHGIAIWRWFRRSEPDTERHYAAYVSDTELAQLKRWGFTAVRLPIGEPFLFGNAASYGTVDPAHIAVLLKAIARINAAGLAVVVDYHPDIKIKARMETEAALRDKTVAFWGTFAKALSGTDPERVMLELLNEPRFLHDAAGWNNYMRMLHAAARAGAPKHTIIVDSSTYAAITTLPEQTLLDDPNIIYTVHFYEPMDFTGQGEAWTDKVSGLPWPSGGKTCDAVISAKYPVTMVGKVVETFANAKGPGPRARRYCAAKWDREKMGSQLAAVAEWSRANHRPIWVGEFGVLGRDAPSDSRLHWFTVAADTFAKYHLASSLWSYDDCWGLSLKVPCTNDAGQERLGNMGACETLRAIGLGGADCIADLRRTHLPVPPKKPA